MSALRDVPRRGLGTIRRVAAGRRASSFVGSARVAAPLVTSALASAFVTVLVWTPRVAEACAVCSAGRDEENQTAFLVSTIFLSLLPLAALGTLVFVLWRRIRRLEAGPVAAVVAGDATGAGLLSGAPEGASERA